jgi:hypothetical protein
MEQIHDLAEAQSLALAIVDTLPEPFLVLDDGLHLLAGSRCFYEVFNEDPATAHGRSLFELSDGQWDIPGLRQLLATVVPQHSAVEGFEFEDDFKHLGRRTMQLNALPIRDESGDSRMVLLAIKDITERRVADQEKQRLLEHTEQLLEQQRTLLREMRHRIANSLQIIASILLLKAGSVTSEETKNELRAAHQRVMSVATVQSHLHASDGIEEIEMGPYLTKLSAGLASSMVGPKQHIDIAVAASAGALPTSHAVSLGLIVTRPDHERHQVRVSAGARFGAYSSDVRESQIRLEADRFGQWRRSIAKRGVRYLDRPRHCPDWRTGQAAQCSNIRDLVAEGALGSGDAFDL